MDRAIIKRILNIVIPTGVGLAVAVFSIFLNKDEYINRISNNNLESIEIILLFIATLIWFSNYIYINIQDIELISDAFPDLISPITPMISVFLMIGISVGFGLLLAFAYDIVIYASIATIFALIDLISDISILRLFSGRHIGEPVANPKQKIHIRYYFHHPTLLRDVLGIFVFVLPIVLLSLSESDLSTELSHFFYFLFIFTILISEWWITIWRKDRNKELIELK